jgi:multidrug efflux system membrane fusion protein
MMWSRILAFVIVVAATLWIGSGVFGRTEEPTEAGQADGQATAQPRFKVAVIPAKLENHARGIVLSGRTEADDRASAVTRAAGSIEELKVRRGDVVAEGDVLAILSDEARASAVAEAEALVAQRRTDLEAKLGLIERGIIARNEKTQLEANLRSAEAALAQAEAEQGRGQVLAPIAGVVSDVPVTTGQALQPNAAVAQIVALDPMLAVVEVAERQLGGVKVGDRASVRLVTGETAEGTVRFVSPTASEGTRTYRVDVEVENRRGTIPDGVTAEVAFKLAPVMAARLPRSALTFSADGTLSVRVVDEGGVVQSVPVKIVEDARQEVWLAGLADDARVIVQGQDFVKEGQAVDATNAAAASPEAVSRS